MEKLLFVYNADSGYFNLVADIAHKIFSPATYPCHLCDLTYGILKIRPEWDEFVKNAPVSLEFLHKDEFHQAHPEWEYLPLPAILHTKGTGWTLFLSAQELDSLQSIRELRALILDRLKTVH